MAKGNTKKSFLDYFKLSDSSDDDFDDDLFDEDEDDYEDEDDMDDRLDDEYDDEDDYDAPQTESRVKASPLKSFNKYKGSASSDNGSARSKAARSSHGQQSGAVMESSYRSTADPEQWMTVKYLLSSRTSLTMRR